MNESSRYTSQDLDITINSGSKFSRLITLVNTDLTGYKSSAGEITLAKEGKVIVPGASFEVGKNIFYGFGNVGIFIPVISYAQTLLSKKLAYTLSSDTIFVDIKPYRASSNLSPVDRTNIPRWKKFTPNFLNGTSDTQDSQFFLFPLNDVFIHNVVVNVINGYTGGPITAAVINVGPDGAPTTYINGFNAFVSGFTGVANTVPLFGSLNLAMQLVVTDGLIQDLTQGSVEIWVLYSALPQ